ncbi:MAG: glycosyltransferase [Candidatus Coatesbacteria bacterium]|nr:glycosyltransferase [Candidatus Coatesbacteria bacterium]
MTQVRSFPGRMPALVSIIIPVYNDERNVAVAIDSALSQTFKDVEIIVVDDGSTDSTPEALNEYEGRIVCVRQENRGLPAARNAGIDASRGKYLCFLDSDDRFLAKKVEIQVDVMEREPTIGLSYGGWLDVDIESGKVLRDFSLARPEHNPDKDAYPPHFPVFSAMVRREWFDKVGVFDERFRAVEDSDLWWRLWAAGCIFRRVKAAVALRRARPGSMSQNITEHSKYALLANRLHLARMGSRAPREVRVRRLAAIWMKQTGHHLSRGEAEQAVKSLQAALRYDRHLLEAPMHWVPLLRQLDLRYPLAEGKGIEDYGATWQLLVTATRGVLEAKFGRPKALSLAAEKSALAYAMSRQAFAAGRVLEAFRWLVQALISGRGRLPSGVDRDVVRRLMRQVAGRVAIVSSRLSGALFGSKHAGR